MRRKSITDKSSDRRFNGRNRLYVLYAAVLLVSFACSSEATEVGELDTETIREMECSIRDLGEDLRLFDCSAVDEEVEEFAPEDLPIDKLAELLPDEVPSLPSSDGFVVAESDADYNRLVAAATDAGFDESVVDDLIRRPSSMADLTCRVRRAWRFRVLLCS